MHAQHLLQEPSALGTSFQIATYSCQVHDSASLSRSEHASYHATELIHLNGWDVDQAMDDNLHPLIPKVALPGPFTFDDLCMHQKLWVKVSSPGTVWLAWVAPPLSQNGG